MNCALWSSEVFEDVDGALKNVHMAVRRGKKLVHNLSHVLYLFIKLQCQNMHLCNCLYRQQIFPPSKNRLHYALFSQQCENCHKPGATVSCCLTSCTNNYHFMCARQQQCAFLEDKKVYCQHHRDLIKGEVRNDTCK